MRSPLTYLLLSLVVSVACTYAGVLPKSGKASPVSIEESRVPSPGPLYPSRTPAPPTAQITAGTYTTLQGWWDYQTGGGACQHVRVNPANGNIHVIMQIADDSANASATRGTAYGFSSDGGQTWNNFNQVRVPNRRSGYPSMDLLRGPNAGLPVIANHSNISGLQSTLFVDSAEGAGSFAEITAPGVFGSDEPIWPYVGGANDGSAIMHGSRQTEGANYVSRTENFATWGAWDIFGIAASGGRNPVAVSSAGTVGTLIQRFVNGCFLFETPDNGMNWFFEPDTVFPPMIIQGPDTLGTLTSCDLTYSGTEPLVAVNASIRSGSTSAFYAGSQIQFWSRATGLKVAVPYDSALYPHTMVSQSNNWALGYPTIATSGNAIVIAYTAFLLGDEYVDTTTGRVFGEIFYVKSTDNGNTWSSPVNVTNSPGVDDRYASLSKWNEDGFVNLVWQEDVYAGSLIIGDAGNLGSIAKQKFLKISLSPNGVGNGAAVADRFTLSQNYPNPFNPSTTIRYSVSRTSPVTITVHNLLGQRVATLVNQTVAPGSYSVTFDGSGLASGFYLYRLQAGTFSETKKLLLLK